MHLKTSPHVLIHAEFRLADLLLYPQPLKKNSLQISNRLNIRRRSFQTYLHSHGQGCDLCLREGISLLQNRNCASHSSTMYFQLLMGSDVCLWASFSISISLMRSPGRSMLAGSKGFSYLTRMCWILRSKRSMRRSVGLVATLRPMYIPCCSTCCSPTMICSSSIWYAGAGLTCS